MPKYYLTRRALLIGITSMIAGPALAEGGGGLIKNQNVKNGYSQREFVKLTSNEITQLYRKVLGREVVLIDGFSPNMTNTIIYMAAARRRRAQGLIREMRKLKSKAQRLKRLRMEMVSIDNEWSKLIASQKRARDKDRRHVVLEAEKKISLLSGYRDSVRIWIKYPHEGTR